MERPCEPRWRALGQVAARPKEMGSEPALVGRQKHRRLLPVYFHRPAETNRSRSTK